jgi:hypothetical protein
MLDLLRALGWHGILRSQNQTHVQDDQGYARPIGELVPGPGKVWAEEGSLPPEAPVPIAAC